MRSRHFSLVFSFPLWVLVALWLLIRRKPVIDEVDIAVKDSLLDEIYYALPVPGNRLENNLVTGLVEWIYRERGALVTLNQAGVRVIGFLKK